MDRGIYTLLGRRVREERLRAKLTLDRLGEHAGISGAFVAHIEAGRKRATLKTVNKIAKALGLSISELLISPADSKREKDIAYINRLRRLLRGSRTKQKEIILRLVQTALELA